MILNQIHSNASFNATLVGIDGHRQFDLNKRDVFIGRAKENDISLVGDVISSRRHAVISCVDGTYYLRDLRSSNGTLLNGKIVEGIVELKADDEIFLGRTRFLFCPSSSKMNSTLSYQSEQDDTTVLGHAKPASTSRFGNIVSAMKNAMKPHPVTHSARV